MLKHSVRKGPRSRVLAVLASLPAFAFMANLASAQAAIGNYTLTPSSVPYTPLTGGTLLPQVSIEGTGAGNFVAGPIPVGFDFVFNGQRYNNVMVSPNGWLSFGTNTTTTGSTSSFNDLNTSTAAIRPLVAPFWDTLDGRSLGNQVSYLTQGAPGSRTFTVEWLNWAGGSANAWLTPHFSFQVVLHEATGRIDFNYRTEAGTPPALSASIGLSELSPNYLSLNDASAAPVASTTTVTNTIASFPANNQRYTFTPRDITAPVTLGSTSSTANSITLNWTPNDATNTAFYMIYRSEDGGTTWRFVERIANTSTSYVNTGLAPGNSYRFRVVAVSEGDREIATTAALSTSAGTVSGGTFEVGPTGTWTSLTAAFTAISAGGTTGTLTLELQPAYTSSGETFPLAVPANIGPTGLTVRPAASVASTLSITNASGAPATYAVFDLNGSDYFTLDGRPGGTGTASFLTVENTNFTAGPLNAGVINLRGDAQNNRFRFLTVRGRAADQSTGVFRFGNAAASGYAYGNSFNTIENSTITAAAGATLPRHLVWSSSSAAVSGAFHQQDGYNQSNSILNSTLSDAFLATGSSTAVFLGSGNTRWTVSNNTFTQTAARTATSLASGNFSHTSIYAQAVADILAAGLTGFNGSGYTFSGNTFGVPTGTSYFEINNSAAANGQSYNGILAATTAPTSTISNNVWRNIRVIAGNSTLFTGAVAFTGNFDVLNNTVGSTTTSAATDPSPIEVTHTNATAATAGATGIQTQSMGFVRFFGNTVGGFEHIQTTTPVASNNASSIGYTGLAQVGTTNALARTLMGGFGPGEGNTIGSQTIADNFLSGYGTLTTRGGSFTGLSVNQSAGRGGVSTIHNNTVGGVRVFVTGTGTTGGSVRGAISFAGQTEIRGNTISNLTNLGNVTAAITTAAVVGIVPNTDSVCLTGSSAIGNTIFGLTAAPANNVASNVNGIAGSSAVTGGVNGDIRNNFIHGLSNITTGAGVTRGIYLFNGNNRVYNNAVRLGLDSAGNSLTGGSVLYYGIEDDTLSTLTQRFYHNTIYIGGTGVGAGTANTAAYRRSTAALLNELRNNVFVNARSNGAGTGRHFGLWAASATPFGASWVSNNNLLSAPGTGGAIGGSTGTPTVHATLSAWQTASGGDAASSDSNPNLANAASGAGSVTTTLLPVVPSSVEGLGTSSLFFPVTTDILGNDRSTLSPVDAGAYAGVFILDPVLSITGVSVLEGNSGVTTATISGTVTNPSASPILGTFSTSNGTATLADNDYFQEVNTPFSIAPSATTFSIAARVRGDFWGELNETFNVTIAATTPGVQIGVGTAQVTIQDDDVTCGTAETFATASGSTPPAGWTQATLGGNPAVDTWRFNNPGARTTSLTAPFAIFDSDNYSNNSLAEDVVLVSPTFDLTSSAFVQLNVRQWFNSGFGGRARIEASTDNGATWPITIQDTTAAIGSGASPANSAFLVPAAAGNSQVRFRFRWSGDWSNWWAIDDVQVCTAPLPPGFSVVSVASAQAAEGAGTLNIPVSITPANANNLTVSYSITPGTATNPADFTGPLTGSVLVPASSPSGSIPVTLVNDTTVEPTKQFSITITGVTGGDSILGSTAATGRILNDDSISTATFIAIDAFNPSTAGAPNKAIRMSAFPGGSLAEFTHPGADSWWGGDFMGNDFTRFYAFKTTGSSPSFVQTLWHVNPTTFAETSVGGDGGAISGSETARGLAWDRAFNRMVVLYGSTTTWKLGTVNLSTGNVTLLGNITGLPAGAILQGPAVDPLTGTLYVVNTAGTPDSVYTVNPTTYAATLLGATGFDHASFFTQLAYVDETGELVFFASEAAGAQPNILYTINKSTGAATQLLNMETEFNMGQTGAAGFESAVQRLAINTTGGTRAQSPADGAYLFAEGASVTLTNDTITSVTAGTRRVTTGWTGTGSVPATGTGNTVTVTLNTAPGTSSITWVRALEHEVTLAVNNAAAGSWVTTPGFRAEGSSFTLDVTVNSGFQLDSITDESSATVTTSNGFNFGPLAAPKTFTANFSVVTSVNDWQVLE